MWSLYEILYHSSQAIKIKWLGRFWILLADRLTALRGCDIKLQGDHQIFVKTNLYPGVCFITLSSGFSDKYVDAFSLVKPKMLFIAKIPLLFFLICFFKLICSFIKTQGEKECYMYNSLSLAALNLYLISFFFLPPLWFA